MHIGRLAFDKLWPRDFKALKQGVAFVAVCPPFLLTIPQRPAYRLCVCLCAVSSASRFRPPLPFAWARPRCREIVSARSGPLAYAIVPAQTLANEALPRARMAMWLCFAGVFAILAVSFS